MINRSSDCQWKRNSKLILITILLHQNCVWRRPPFVSLAPNLTRFSDRWNSANAPVHEWCLTTCEGATEKISEFQDSRWESNARPLLRGEQIETSTHPSGQTPGTWTFEDFRPLGPKWCSNDLPCLPNAPPKEQSSSVPVVCNKAYIYLRCAETLIQDRKLF